MWGFSKSSAVWLLAGVFSLVSVFFFSFLNLAHRWVLFPTWIRISRTGFSLAFKTTTDQLIVKCQKKRKEGESTRGREGGGVNKAGGKGGDSRSLWEVCNNPTGNILQQWLATVPLGCLCDGSLICHHCLFPTWINVYRPPPFPPSDKKQTTPTPHNRTTSTLKP